MPLVSIIVPVYKTEKYLPQCLDSLLAQTLTDLELILIDDGSPDNCPRICDEYAAKYPHIRVIHQENSGQTATRRAGLSIAQGEFIAFSDSDDWVEPDMYQKMVDAALQNDADMVFTGFVREYESRSESCADPLASGIYAGDALKELIVRAPFDIQTQQQGLSPALWNKLLRKELAMEVFYTADDRIRFGEDALCVYGALMKAKRVVIAGEQRGYHYRIWENSVTQTYNPRFYHDLFILQDRLQEIFAPVAKEAAPALAYNYAYLYYLGLNQLTGSSLKRAEKQKTLASLVEDRRLSQCTPLLNPALLPGQMYRELCLLAEGHRLQFNLYRLSLRVKNKLRRIFRKG